MKFPKIKKKVNAFLLEEEGKISKKNMIRGGVVLGAAALALLQSQKLVSAVYSDNIQHNNGVLMAPEQANSDGQMTAITGEHNHHLSHQSHESHSVNSGMGG